MKKHIEVVAAIIRKDNKVFCAQRADKGELAKKWEFPGGKIEVGETHQQALIREIKEELNADIVVNDFLLTVNHEYQTFYLTMHCYECVVVSGELTINEHLDSKWLMIEEMYEYDFAQADMPVINHMLVDNK
ncbi:8-oxo-dGTP diphosphatase MutT [Peloplasma aerotolerans]|uniref:8-oxo-dGTP diphosphatase n=1 Tax=Peloplasma aerotolerans TaxID=3044389 RepID=A0AAW6U7T9_9MOLU|nr:8-oxo-dGTP diphosphatase MutT [Mariniplasma sp. M4Ah]MDI6452840.1 8-oxo-dGTP diphosphatase MutT [Mariniplasma sp. M4Ah]MDR4969509.1 8-oxo-dGTP diphosphatase MutT [Acholeplasmataceae bacterium]